MQALTGASEAAHRKRKGNIRKIPVNDREWEIDMHAPSHAEMKKTFRACLSARKSADYPYQHWFLNTVVPPKLADALADLPFPVQFTEGESGKRELHNATRSYFDPPHNEKHAECKAVADLFQDSEVVGWIAKELGCHLDGTFLRIEYAQDTNGFWLQPHTDLGVKKFTMLWYLSDGEGHEALGTDMYVSETEHFGRSPFQRNGAFIFVPSDKSWHGFEKREIKGVRKSIIINYVTNDWRARDQLAFGEVPVKAA